VLVLESDFLNGIDYPAGCRVQLYSVPLLDERVEDEDEDDDEYEDENSSP
jgi:hypothetical protein